MAATLVNSAQPKIEPLVCEGSPWEIGEAQGAAVKSKIHAARQMLSQLESFRMRKPRWLPYRFYRRLAERKAARFLAKCSSDPAMQEQLHGIAVGADLPRPAICLFNALEPLLSSVGGCTACPGACSAVAVRGSRSATGELMLARNFDYLPLVQPFYIVRDRRPRNQLRAIEFTTAPLAGAIDGINERGLCITYNYGFTIDPFAAPAAPISVSISEALSRCSSVAEAAAFISSRPRCGGALLMLCDASGEMASLELSSTRSFLRRPATGEDAMFHTNMFSDPQMCEVQISRDAVYTERAPKPLRGRRLHQSSEMRNARFASLLQQAGPLTANDLGAIMADHGPTGRPDDFTPCVHGSYWFTTACLQFFPQSRRLRVSYSSACQAQFTDLAL